MINKINFLLIIACILSIGLQITPWGLENYYDIFRIVIISEICILLLLNIKTIRTSLVKYKLLRKHLVVVLLLYFIGFLFLIWPNNFKFDPIYDLLVTLIILIISFGVTISNKKYNAILNIFILATSAFGLSIVIYYAHGFNILPQYLDIPKNQISPIFALSSFLSICMYFITSYKYKKIYIFFFVLNILYLLVIRGRASIIALSITSIVFYLYYIKMTISKIIIAILAIIIIFITPLWSMVQMSLFMNYDTNDFNSISTGRFDIYLYSLDHIYNNLLFGDIFSLIPFNHRVHNYILDKLFLYGTIIGTLFIYLYIYYIMFIYKMAKKIIKNKTHTFNTYSIAPLVIAIPFIVSFFEYTFPFSPGTALFVYYFILGQSIKNNYD